MEKSIKLIWDFRGIDAEKTAVHHTKHLEEFSALEKLAANTGTERITDLHFTAFLTIPENLLQTLKHRLKPHRAQWAD